MAPWAAGKIGGVGMIMVMTGGVARREVRRDASASVKLLLNPSAPVVASATLAARRAASTAARRADTDMDMVVFLKRLL